MTFDELTYGISFLTPLFAAFLEGKKAGFLGVLIGLLVGFGLGIGGVFGTKAVFKCIRQHRELGKRNPPPLWTVLSWILCIALFVCIGGLGLLGMIATKLVIRGVIT
jgi:hypothetical protein